MLWKRRVGSIVIKAVNVIRASSHRWFNVLTEIDFGGGRREGGRGEVGEGRVVDIQFLELGVLPITWLLYLGGLFFGD